MSETTDFTLINRLTVSIASQKIQLSKCESPDEMDRICKSISDMEMEILNEKKKELKSWHTKKEDILQKMAVLESSLDDVNREINARVSRYRDSVCSRILRLENEVNGKMSEMVPPSLE